MSELIDQLKAGLPDAETARQIIKEVAEMEKELAEARGTLLKRDEIIRLVEQHVRGTQANAEAWQTGIEDYLQRVDQWTITMDGLIAELREEGEEMVADAR